MRSILSQALSGDLEQDYFADGMVKEIAIPLSHILLWMGRFFDWRYPDPMEARTTGENAQIRLIFRMNGASTQAASAGTAAGSGNDIL